MSEEVSEFDLNDGKGTFYWNGEGYGVDYTTDIEPDHREDSDLMEAIPQSYVEGSWVGMNISDKANPD